MQDIAAAVALRISASDDLADRLGDLPKIWA